MYSSNQQGRAVSPAINLKGYTMERIYNMYELAKVYRSGECKATDFTLLTIAEVLHNKRMMWEVLRGSAMLAIDAANAAVEEAVSKVDNPAKAYMPREYRTGIYKQVRAWLKEHGTTLTALKSDYNNATYANCYALGLRTVTYYKVPEILADLIARTSDYAQRDIIEA